MDLDDLLRGLADRNVFGVGFLAAYGISWLVCGLCWRGWGTQRPQLAAYVTLFQGLAALPLALGFQTALGGFGEDRAVPESITQLSVLVGMSQLLGLPFLILLVATGRHTLVPAAFAAVTSIHFIVYSWLYQTVAYLVMSVVIAIGAPIVMARADEAEALGAAQVCWFTSAVLLGTAGFLTAVHWLG